VNARTLRFILVRRRAAAVFSLFDASGGSASCRLVGGLILEAIAVAGRHSAAAGPPNEGNEDPALPDAGGPGAAARRARAAGADERTRRSSRGTLGRDRGDRSPLGARPRPRKRFRPWFVLSTVIRPRGPKPLAEHQVALSHPREGATSARSGTDAGGANREAGSMRESSALVDESSTSAAPAVWSRSTLDGSGAVEGWKETRRRDIWPGPAHGGLRERRRG